MRRLFHITFLIGILLLLAFAFIPADSFVSAQESFKGEWTAELKDKDPDKIQLNLNYTTEKGGRNSNGSHFSFSDLQGLDRRQALSSNSSVNFQITREAGTISLEGTFREGRGVGFFTFTPNQNFVQAMQSRGFTDITTSRLMSAVNVDLTIRFVDDFKSIGFQEPVTFKDVIKAKIFNVNSAFVNEMRSVGFENLTLKELVKARIFKVDSGFVAQVRGMGFENLTMKDLTKLQIHKITPAYIEEIKAEGFTNLTVRDITKMKIHKVDSNFIREIKAEGYSTTSVSEIVKLKIHKVDGEFIRQAKADGHTNLTLKELVKLKIRGKVK